MRFKFILLFFVLFLVGVVALFFTKRTSNELKALEESASVIQLRTAHEVRRWSQDKGVALGKPLYAEVRIEYEPANHYSQEDVYNEIISTLEKHGYQKEKLSVAYPGYFRATLLQNDFLIVTEVVTHSESNLVSVQFEIERPK